MTSHDNGEASNDKQGHSHVSRSLTVSHDRVFVRNLHIPMNIGITADERREKQTVIVNLELDVKRNPNWQSDDISNVISYADIKDGIEKIAGSREFNLLETFIEVCADFCFSFDICESVRIRAEKPDIFDETDSVGVEILRLRSVT